MAGHRANKSNIDVGQARKLALVFVAVQARSNLSGYERPLGMHQKCHQIHGKRSHVRLNLLVN